MLVGSACDPAPDCSAFADVARQGQVTRTRLFDSKHQIAQRDLSGALAQERHAYDEASALATEVASFSPAAQEHFNEAAGDLMRSENSLEVTKVPDAVDALAQATDALAMGLASVRARSGQVGCSGLI